MKILDTLRRGWMVFLLASLTLGLAPFTPEPHIWEKIRWISAGEFPMEGMYIFDLFLHGSPWILLIVSALLNLKNSISKAPTKQN